jgi:hypothetical protein
MRKVQAGWYAQEITTDNNGTPTFTVDVWKTVEMGWCVTTRGGTRRALPGDRAMAYFMKVSNAKKFAEAYAADQVSFIDPERFEEFAFAGYSYSRDADRNIFLY